MPEQYGYQKCLPTTASDIKVFVWKEDLLPDYEYYLKAKISKQDFLRYIDTFNLVLYSDTLKFEDDAIWNGLSGVFRDSVKTWWLVDESKDSSYIWNKGQEWNVAKYENGYLYFYANNH